MIVRWFGLRHDPQRIRLDRDSSAARSHELNRLLYKPGFLTMSYVDYFLRLTAFLLIVGRFMLRRC